MDILLWLSKPFSEKSLSFWPHNPIGSQNLSPSSNSALCAEFSWETNSFLEGVCPYCSSTIADECCHETELVFMCLWYEALRNERIRNFHPASASSFTNTSSCSVHNAQSFCGNDTHWIARTYSEDAGSENIHLRRLAFKVREGELKALKRGVAGRKGIR